MNLLIQKVSRSKRVQAIGTMIVMSVMLINPFLQIPLSATQAAQAKSTVPASSQSPQCSEVMMYAISDEGTDDSYFLAFNTNTGQGGVVNYKDNYDIEAIDIHPQTGVIYGLAGDSNDVSDVKRLLTIDPVSGIPDLSTGVDLHLSEGQEYRGMSFNPTTGELWATGDNVELVTIDINTGVATQKYNVSGDPDGLAWNTDGTILYVLYENGKLYTYNGSSMSLSCSGLGKAEGLEMDPNGNLVIGYHNNNSIYTEFVNPATCATTPATEYNANYEDIETITFACLDVPENPICGNGIKETGEQCDDGNVVNGDGCSNQCTIDALVCTDQTMYFISDKSSGNSYFVKYNTATQNETFINYKNQYDIEAIDIDPVSNKIYALAGDNKGSNDYKKLLVLDRGTGIPDISTGIDLGLVDEQEYQGMSFNPVTGELWAAGRDVELVTINLTTGTATEKKNIQGGADALAWDNAGENLYLLYENDRLDRYQNGTIQTMCTNVEGATGMEFEPNGNMLIIGYTGGNVWTEIMDPNTCTRVAHTSHTSTYKDVETLTSECTPAQYCGNGILETGEACDEGTNNGSLTCSEQCTIPVGTIAGCKYADANNNGVIDSGETKLADWTIILSKNGTEVARTTTNENGCYAFTDVALATYTVSEEQQTGWQQTYPSTNNGIHTVEFTAPQTIANIDFANYEVPVNTTYCGDGVVQNPNDNGQNELCDEGANNGNICSPDYGNSCSYCSTTCQPVDVEGPYCGDGQLDTNHEQCDDGNNQDGDGCSATCTTEDFACELELTKVVDKTTAGLGDTVNYTVQVKNVGDADCTNVTLTDTFPGGVAIVDSTPTPTSGSTVWNVGTLTPNQTATVTMVGEIEKNNTLCESTLTNSVVAVADDVDQTDPATASTAIECEPPQGECRLKLVKEDKADPIAPGDDLTYTLTLTNIGDASCTNVTLEEDYDENTTYVSATPAPTMGTNKWVVGSMLPNDVFTVDVTVSVAASENLCEAQLLNTAYYDSAQTTQGSTSENTAVVCEQEPVYDLALTKTVNDDSVRVNEKTMFTITVTNQGNQGMSNVVVKEYLPSQLRLDSNQTSQGTFDTNTMEWSVGDLAIGQTETLDLTVTVTEAGTFVNKAEVISHTETDTDSTPNNGTDNNEDDTDAASVSADNGGGSGGCVTNCGGGGGPVLPTISIVKTAGVQFTNPDTIVTYTVKVTNTSSVFGRDLVVTDTLPAPLTYVSSTLTGTWNLGDINAGETKTITYDVKYPEGIAKGNYTNIAKATISNGNSDEDDAVVEVRIPSVQGEQYAPILKIEKSVDRSFTNPGSEAVYTVVVTNVTTNNVTAKNVKLVDRMPGVFTFADNGASVHGWNLGDLLPGESRTVVYTIDVADDATNGSYDNLAAANADNAPEVYATVPLEVRQVIVEGFTLPDTNGAMNLFLSIVAGGLMIALALMIRKYRELTLIELA